MTEHMTVIYNESCPICAREIGTYRRIAEAQGLPVAFEGLDSEALAAEGIGPDEAARRLHVIRGDEVLRGTDAFIALWTGLPRFHWLARIVALPVVRPLAGAIYEGLAAPWLYRRHRRRLRRRTEQVGSASCSASSTTSTPRSSS